MGLVGARFERSNVMEYSLMQVGPRQNTKENGYGQLGVAHDDQKEQIAAPDEEGPLSLVAELDPQAFMQRVRQSAQIEGSKPVNRAFEKFYNRYTAFTFSIPAPLLLRPLCVAWTRTHLPLYDEVRQKWTAEDEHTRKRFCVKNKWEKAPFLDMDIFRCRMRVKNILSAHHSV